MKRGTLAALFLLVVAEFYFSSTALWAQTSDSQGDANKSWSATTDLQNDGANPTRTVESHVQNGNRATDTQSLQRRDSDGNFAPYQDIEKTTVQVDANTVRTTTRTFGRDSDGAKTLVQVTEEEKRTQPGGDSRTVRSTSNPDANGNLQLVQRETEETKKTGKDSEETRTTVMLPNADGGLSPAMMTQERSAKSSNDTIESQKTTLLPDLNGNWQVSEVQREITRKDGTASTVDKRVSRPDADGKLAEVSRTVTRESGDKGPGEKRATVEKYSVDVPGTARDGNLHIVERATTLQNTSANGQQNTRRQIEKPDPGDPDAGLQVTVVTNNNVRIAASGAQSTHTIQMRDADGNLGTVSVDTANSNDAHAVQVQIAPSSASK